MNSPVIGLTGILGSGKSAAAAQFARLGATVIDMDQAGKWVVDNLKEVRQQLMARFGEDIVDQQGTLLRKKLGQRVFADEKELRALNSIVHPAMLKRVKELIARAKEKSALYIVVDAALIYEVEFDRHCDLIAVVAAPVESCIERAIATKGLTREQALQRIGSQISQDEKCSRADIVIENTGTLADLQQKVARVHQIVMAKFGLVHEK